MPTELHLLIWSIILGLVHAAATGAFASAQFGLAYSAGPRDEQKQVTGVGARVTRAFHNFMQTFPFFAAAVLMAALLGRHTFPVVMGAQLYFWSRLFYVPLYAAGVPMLRSVVWGVSMLGIVMVLFGL